jgi:hypothetical protein
MTNLPDPKSPLAIVKEKLSEFYDTKGTLHQDGLFSMLWQGTLLDLIPSDLWPQIYCAWIIHKRNQGVYHLKKKISGPGRLPGRLTDPSAAVVDDSGNYYVADGGNNRVQVFDKNGAFIKILESLDQLCKPCALTFTRDGGLVILDHFYGHVHVRDPSTTAPANAFGSYHLGRPLDVAVDAGGNFWVVDFNHRITVCPSLLLPLCVGTNSDLDVWTRWYLD